MPGNHKRAKFNLTWLLIPIAVVAITAGIMILATKNSRKYVAAPGASPIATSSVKQSLEPFRGKVVILDFWATWCGPCRMEIPGFIELQKKYRDQGLEVIGVSLDPLTPDRSGAAAVAQFMKSYGINYHIWTVDSTSALAGYDVTRGIPTTYLLDRDGRIVKTYVGAQPVSVFERDIKQLF
jgi:thiol-disulfide isomerase/thioredoxin